MNLNEMQNTINQLDTNIFNKKNALNLSAKDIFFKVNISIMLPFFLYNNLFQVYLLLR